MKCLNFLIASIVISVSLPVLANSELAGKTIRICDDGAEWPPFSYYLRQDGVKTENVVGFSVDVTQKILVKQNLANVEYSLVPWKRWLRELAQGYPNGLAIKNPQEFSEYIACGLRGYNYQNFNIDQSIIDMHASNFKQAFSKLSYKRCNMVLARIEVLYGFGALGMNYLTDDHAYQQVPNTKKMPFYMLISKKSPHSKELKQALDQGIKQLQQSGELEKMLRRYLGN